MRPYLQVLIMLFPIVATAQTFDNGYHFYLPPNDSTTQRFLPTFPKKAADSYVTTNADGQFMADGQPIRFWGMNMAYGACFPDKDKAAMIAARLRKMGVNLVRFTLMDSPWTNEDGTIFFGQTTTQVLNFFNLDRLHFFIAQLKNEGIYTNLVLQNARTYREGDGVLHADSISATAKAVTMFDRHLRKLQRDFSLQLLSPVNLYTGMSLAEDPAVAMVDITNENTLYGYWKSDLLRHKSKGGDLIQRHVDTLDVRWNEFLQNKYASQTILETTWNQTAGAGGQNEQVVDGGFESGDPSANFIMELHDVAQATIIADASNPFNGNYSGRVDVLNATSTNWHIQFKQTGASLEALKTYQITFAARAESARDIIVVASRDNAPYTYYDGQTISLTQNWQTFKFTFMAPENNDANFRLGFQFNGQEGSYWFDNLSMTDADIAGRLPGESLAAGNIRRMDYSERFDYSPHRMADNTEFYLSVQTEYFDKMYAYLKDELNVQANISGSNTWSGISDIYTARNLDFVNDQSTWDYIRYPNGWSQSNWYIENTALVKAGWSTIQHLFGGFAVKGKPYTVGQYSHPFPNRYQIEMMPWMTAYGAFHDAGAINFYYYNDEHDSWSADRVDDYFSLHRNTAQMALSPIYSYAFRNGLIAPAEQVFEIEYSLPFLRALPLSDGSGRWGKYMPYNSSVAYSHSVRTKFGGAGAPDLSQIQAPSGSLLTTDTDETTIDYAQGILKTVSPRFISLCGFLNENGAVAGALKVLSSNDFGVVSWLSLTDQPLGQSHESMLAISSKLQNTNMAWDGINTIHNNWGGQPTEMFPLQLTLELEIDADYLQIYPLSETGGEQEAWVVTPISAGRFLVNIDQSEEQTTWYGIEAMTGTPTDGEWATGGVSIYPNPTSDLVFVQWPSVLKIESISLLSADGKTMEDWVMPDQQAWQLDVSHLPTGVYFLKIQGKEKVFLDKLLISRH